MATYVELDTLSTDATLLAKMRSAIAVAADVIRQEANTAPNNLNRKQWAIAALKDPTNAAKNIIWLVLAQNKAVTVAQINAASDATIQTAVDNVINILAGA